MGQIKFYQDVASGAWALGRFENISAPEKTFGVSATGAADNVFIAFDAQEGF